MSDEQQTAHDDRASELEREERRLARLRLVPMPWPVPERLDEEPEPRSAA
jgi:hypothetical protein